MLTSPRTWAAVAIVCTKIKKFVTMVSKSTYFAQQLRASQEAANTPLRKPVKPNATRWNSMYDCMLWLLLQRGAFDHFNKQKTTIENFPRANLPTWVGTYEGVKLSVVDWALVAAVVSSWCLTMTRR